MARAMQDAVRCARTHLSIHVLNAFLRIAVSELYSLRQNNNTYTNAELDKTQCKAQAHGLARTG